MRNRVTLLCGTNEPNVVRQLLWLSCSAVSDSATPWTLASPGSSVRGDSPGKNTGAGCHALLQGIFPTQGWNPGLLCWQVDSLLQNHQGSPHQLIYSALEFCCWPHFWGGFPGGARGKDPACWRRRCERCRFDSWVGKIPWRRKWQPTPVCLPGKSHGQRSLVGYRPRGPKRVGHNLVMKPTTNLPFLNIFSLSEQYVC